MEDFCTADGDIINPYYTLKVDRHATRTEIRHSYRELSKKYHPDAVRFRKIMPGKCDTLDEVRDEWERIKLSYEILSDKKMRLKYDRQSALNDPGKALGRVALDTVSWGVTGLAKGIFHIGKQAVNAAADAASAKKNGDDYPRDEALVKADKRNRRRKKERMVQHIELQESTTIHDRKLSVGDSLSGNNNLLPFDSQLHLQRRRNHFNTFETKGYSSLAVVSYIDPANQRLPSIRGEIIAFRSSLNSLVQDATIFAHDYKHAIDETIQNVCDSLPILGRNWSLSNIPEEDMQIIVPQTGFSHQEEMLNRLEKQCLNFFESMLLHK